MQVVSSPPSAPKPGSGQFKVHFGLALATLLCVPAFVFELSRALGGNTLSWAYVFEWPIFECFAIYMWWKLLHEDDAPKAAKPATPRQEAASAADQVKLDAWNAYLEQLAESEAQSED